MAYELMDLSTGNLIGVYPTEMAALDDVAEVIQRYGDEEALTPALSTDDQAGGQGYILLEGAALVRCAKLRLPSHRVTP